MDFKVSIREARLKSGLSQEKAGNAINRTRNAIRGYESGISTPDPDQLVILCKLYGTTPNDLLGFFQQQNEEAKMKHPEVKNTELPWHYQKDSDEYTHIIRDQKDNIVVHLKQDTSGKAEADAAFIVKAVNNHDALLGCLKELVYNYPKNNCIPLSLESAKLAIKQAETES